MKSKYFVHRFSKSVLALIMCGLTTLPVGAFEQILTERASKDYEQRLKSQPELKKQMSLKSASTSAERDALKFLYAYLASSDIIDYTPDFYLENIRTSLQAADEMPWGKKVPDREWRHFVLPVRVNNENLDQSRKVFYEELKDRVKNLSMKDAILEVNHWCHEKVTYQPSDGRTSSPLATVCNALGRCGEESTFTVAALRSVGIPARQVYTPRWAHTDDNHAWVEAWADGQWYFLGACEPEAILNLAWFNAPAARGMLMNTTVLGAYDGPEEVLATTPTSTTINVTSNYAPVELKKVKVLDKEGRPVKDARVNFSLYNYAEFYPLAIRTTDSNGIAEMISGKGDLVVWASDGKNFNLGKTSGPDTLVLVLDKDANFDGEFIFDIVPPRQTGTLPTPTAEEARINEERKVKEDSIRSAYEATFFHRANAEEICGRYGVPADGADLLVKSRGNARSIIDLLFHVPTPLQSKVIDLLNNISEKDLHDVSREVLWDHFKADPVKTPLYNKYILNPRVENEMLTAYRSYLKKAITKKQAEAWKNNPRELEKYLRENIRIDSVYMHSYRISPKGVWETKLSDPLSRSILFVAICRTLGVPSRIDPVSHLTQYADTSGQWNDVTFGNERHSASAEKGYFTLSYSGEGREPAYYSHFTISKVNEGLPTLFEFDEFEPYSSINLRKEPLESGQYVLVSGQRLADGTVLSKAKFFHITPGEETGVALEVRQDTTALQVIGSLDAELLYQPLDDKNVTSILSTVGRGYYVIGLVKPGHEPSAHAINDISAAAKALESTGRKILLLFPDNQAASRFESSNYGKLPSNVELGVDIDYSIAKAIKNGLELKSEELPIVCVADSFNRIVFFRQGYTIHLGEQLAKTLERLAE